MIKLLAGVVIGIWIEGYLRRAAELSDTNLAQIVGLWEQMDTYGDPESLMVEDETDD